jgi:hypothetical protein
MPADSKSIWCYLSWTIVLLYGCSGKVDRSGDPANPPTSAEPADSLVLSAPSGLEVWFRLARPARSSNGTSCLERGLEIRRRGRRTQVPLLYTRETPTLLNDSTLRAMLWSNCRPVAPYLIDLSSGRPVPERRRRPSR